VVVDFHNHLIPGVDDGAQTLEESVEALECFRRDGVNVVVATPHIDASLTLEPSALSLRLGEIDEGWALLEEAVARDFPDMTVHRGCELALDVPKPDLTDPRLRLNGGRYVLIEFPFMTVPPRASHVIGSLRETGYVPIIAHPERYHGVSGVEPARRWRASGAFLQVNGASLLGRYGAEPRRLAFELLGQSLADYICSDYHARGVPQTSEYEALLIDMGANEQASTLMRINPARMLEGLEPLPVAPVIEKKSLWGRVSKIFH
jgi:protein-tyrosine phosphatase